MHKSIFKLKRAAGVFFIGLSNRLHRTFLLFLGITLIIIVGIQASALVNKERSSEDIVAVTNIGAVVKTTNFELNPPSIAFSQTALATSTGTYLVFGVARLKLGDRIEKRKMKNGQSKVCHDQECWSISGEVK